MEKISLKEFVADALDEICCAVEEAQSNHSVIAPKNEAFISNIRDTSCVEFDLAVEITERQNSDTSKTNAVNGEIEGKAKLLSVINIKSKVSGQLSDAAVEVEENIHSSQNRIKFSVPVYFQYSEDKRREHEFNMQKHKNTSMNRDSGW